MDNNPLKGGILNMVANIALNEREGLPWYSTGEERLIYKQQQMELRKEQIKSGHELVKGAADIGDMDTIDKVGSPLVQKGAITQDMLDGYKARAQKTLASQQQLSGFLQNIQQMGQGQGGAGGQGVNITPPGQQQMPSVQPQSYQGGAPLQGMPQSTSQIPYYGMIASEAAKNGITPQEMPAVLGLIHAESGGFNSNATSPTGVKGLMQTTGETTTRNGYDPNDRMNPATSIGAGMKEIARLKASGVDISDPSQLVNGYTTPAGGGTPKYINKVAQYTQHYAGLLQNEQGQNQQGQQGEGQVQGQTTPTSNQPPSPIGQPVSSYSMGQGVVRGAMPQIKMPSAVQPLLGTSVTMDKFGNPTHWNIDPSKMVPTEQQLITQTVTQDPALFQLWTQSKLWGTEPFQIMPVVDNIKGMHGYMAIRKMDGAMMGTFWNGQQTELTPWQKQAMEVATSGAKTGQEIKSKVETYNQPIGTPGVAAPQAPGQNAPTVQTPPAVQTVPTQTPQPQVPVNPSAVNQVPPGQTSTAQYPPTTYGDAIAQQTAKEAGAREGSTQQAKMAQQNVPAQNLLGEVKNIYERVFPGNTNSFVGRMSNGIQRTIEARAKSGLGYDWKQATDLLSGAITRDLDGRFNMQAYQTYHNALTSVFQGRDSVENAIKMMDNVLSTVKKEPAPKQGEYKTDYIYHFPDPLHEGATKPMVVKGKTKEGHLILEDVGE